jgi:Cu-processing system permease protein
MTGAATIAGPVLVPKRERLVTLTNFAIVARKEIRDSLRNRWFLFYTVAFIVLSLGLSYMSQVGTGMSGFAGFGPTAASLINLVILIVPLMALTAGAGSLAGERERGTLTYLLSQPVTRVEVLVGKYIGLATALLATLALGFGTSAGVIAARGGGDPLSYLKIVVLAFSLALAMLSVGTLVSVMCKKASTATGAAIFLWLALVFLGDLGLMGSTIAFKLQVADLFQLSLLNPMQVFKMAAIGSINVSLDVLGPAGLYAINTYGARLPLLLAAALGGWIILPLVAALVLFTRRSIS